MYSLYTFIFILTGQLIEDKVLKIVDQLNVSLSFTSVWINAIDGELIDQCIWTNHAKELDLIVLILWEIDNSTILLESSSILLHDFSKLFMILEP